MGHTASTDVAVMGGGWEVSCQLPHILCHTYTSAMSLCVEEEGEEGSGMGGWGTEKVEGNSVASEASVGQVLVN